MIFYQGGIIDHVTHVPGLVAQYGAESGYNAACTEVMDLPYFRMLIHEWFNKDTDIVTQAEPLIILYIKSDFYIYKNGKDTKHTSNISRRVHFVRNGENAKCTRLTGVKEV